MHGTTAGNFTISGTSGTLVAFQGTVVFTTKHGVLTSMVIGSLDTASGAFQSTGPVSTATGKLTGATGTLTLMGVEDLVTGHFVEDVSGTLYVDLAP